MDRHAQIAPLEVPQGLVDTGDGAHQDRPAAVETGAIQGLPEMLDAMRILADQVIGELVHRRLDGRRTAFHHRLAPAEATLVGLDLEKQPARRYLPGFQLVIFKSSPIQKLLFRSFYSDELLFKTEPFRDNSLPQNPSSGFVGIHSHGRPHTSHMARLGQNSSANSTTSWMAMNGSSETKMSLRLIPAGATPFR